MRRRGREWAGREGESGIAAASCGAHPVRIGPTLVSWRDLAGGGAATQQTPDEIRACLKSNGIFPGYSFHQESSPARLGDVVASHAFVYDQVSLKNVFSKRIDAVTFAAIVERLRGPVTIVRSSPVPMSLDPDQSATARVQVAWGDGVARHSFRLSTSRCHRRPSEAHQSDEFASRRSLSRRSRTHRVHRFDADVPSIPPRNEKIGCQSIRPMH